MSQMSTCKVQTYPVRGKYIERQGDAQYVKSHVNPQGMLHQIFQSDPRQESVDSKYADQQNFVQYAKALNSKGEYVKTHFDADYTKSNTTGVSDDYFESYPTGKVC